MNVFKLINFLFFVVLISPLFCFCFRKREPLEPMPLFSESTLLGEKGDLLISQFSSYIKLEDNNKQWEKLFLNNNEVAYCLTDNMVLVFTVFYKFDKFLTNDPLKIRTENGFLTFIPRMEFALYKKKSKKEHFTLSFAIGLNLQTLHLGTKTKYLKLNKDFIDLNNKVFENKKLSEDPSLGVLFHLYADYLSTKWYGYVTGGTLTSIKYKNLKAGNRFFCNFGFGPVITHSEDLYFSILAEFNTEFIGCDTKQNLVDFNSGSESVFAGLTTFYSYKNLTLQLGFQVPLIENLFDQTSLASKFRIAAYLALAF